jgi:hypothetical protein
MSPAWPTSRSLSSAAQLPVFPCPQSPPALCVVRAPPSKYHWSCRNNCPCPDALHPAARTPTTCPFPCWLGHSRSGPCLPPADRAIGYRHPVNPPRQLLGDKALPTSALPNASPLPHPTGATLVAPASLDHWPHPR